ncbi:MAG TPA: hypothetical protein VGE41_13185, partial [Verrucomicrobiae bacterium]
GYSGQLWIEGIDANGNLLGSSTVYGQTIIGFWDDQSWKLTFMRLIDKGNPSSFQIYTGYLMQSQDNGSLAFAGSFEAFQGSGAVARRVVYGWYAVPR